MSRALLGLFGLEGVPDVVAASVLGALHEACNLRHPVGRYALLVTPDCAKLVRRVEVVDEFHAMGLHGLASKIARLPARGDALAVVAVGDDAPRCRTIPLAPLRIAFISMKRRAASAATNTEKSKGDHE